MRRNFPRPYTTTYLRVVVWVNSWPLQIRKLPPSFRLYLRVSLPSLSTPSVSRSLSMPFRLMLSPCFRSSQPRPLAMLHQFLAYLPGLPLRVPRRWWMVKDSNLRWSGVPTFPIYCLVHNPLTGAFDLSAQPSFYVLCFWRFR